MGDAVEKLSGKLGIDTTDFKTGISAANRELRVLESSFKAGAASMEDWTQSATGLESRIKSLTSQIDIQKLKVAALKEEHAKLVEANGENSRAAQDAEIKLNKETEQLGKMENELSNCEQNLGDMANAESDVGTEADAASGQVGGMGSALASLGAVAAVAVAAVVAVAAATIAVGAAIGGLVFSTAEASGALTDLSAKTGFTTTQLQEMSFIGNQLGVSLDTITGAQSKLIRSMSTATKQQDDYNKKLSESVDPLKVVDLQNKYEKSLTASTAAIKKYGADSQQAKDADIARMLALQNLNDAQTGNEVALGDSAAAFQQLGVSITDANGNLRDSQTVYAETIDALGKVANPAERDALAMSIFGKSAMELNPLIKTGSAGMEEMAQKGRDLGAVMSEETVSSFDKFGDTVDGLKDGLKGVLGELAGAFLPGFQMVFDQAGGYLKDFKAIVDGSGGDIGKIADGMSGLVTQIITDITAQAPQLMQAGMTILMSVVNSIVTNLPTMIGAGVGMLLTLVQGLITALPAIIDAGLKAIITLATGITQALPTLLPTLVNVIVQIVNIIVANLPMIIQAALQLIIALALGLVQALPVLIAALPQIIEAILNALIAAMPMITDAAGQLIGVLALGIVTNIPILLAAMVELIARLGEALANWAKTMPEVGKNLLTGIWQGMQANAGAFRSQLMNFFKSIVDNIKSVLGIHSPSDVMADEVGKFIPPGIGQGVQRAMPALKDNLKQQMLGLTSNLKANISTTSSTAGSQMAGGQTATAGSQISIGDIIVNVTGTNATPKQIGAAVQDSLLKSLRAVGAA